MKPAILLLSIASVAFLSACGQSSAPTASASATASVAATAPASAASASEPAVAAASAAAPENTVGKGVYNKTCSLCHAANVAGAPKPGDKADWSPRIAQGMDVLHKHALEGFTGAKGQMPARGGAATLSDDEVKAAVVYMVDKSR